MHCLIKIGQVYITLLAWLWISFQSQAQEKPRNEVFGTASISASNGDGALALAIAQNFGVGKSRRFKIGYGLRLSGYASSAKDFVTAPARLTSASQNLGTIFSESYEQNYDTLHLGTSQVYMLNLLINLEYAITPKWDIGFNIDAAGFSFGPEKNGLFQTSLSSPYAGQNVSAKPTKLNLLLTSDNDLGSLNSEGFIRYRYTEKIGFNLGFTFLFAEYRTNTKLTFENDRFRHKSLMAMLGICLKLR